jgi:peptidoglycan/LPS O-acetylase OafA/YrhL
LRQEADAGLPRVPLQAETAAHAAQVRASVPGTAASTAPSRPSAAKYRPDVDGLRAVAVIPVLFFHTGISLFSGGYTGVDIFFVISGFVITRKLVDDMDAGQYSIASFYVRRIRRIVPALIATILVCYIAALILFLPDAMLDFSRSVVATALFVSNIYFWRSSGYFEIQALDRPLLHTWSLSIEEQFYLVIPVALYIALRHFRKHAGLLFAVAAVGSLALSAFVTYRAPTANFFLLPTRAWELLIGALLVLLPLVPMSNLLLREGLALVGLAMIALAIITYSDATPFPGLAALLPTLGAAIIIYTGSNRTTLVGRTLSFKPMVFIGLISYSLYLVHWPMIVFARYALLRDLEGWEIAAFACASLLLAYASFRFVETPFRHPGPRSARRPLFFATGAVLSAVTLLGVAGVATVGFRARFPDFRQNQASAEDVWLSGRCFLENQDASAWQGDLCVRTKGAARNALLWGDSFAAHYLPGLIRNSAHLSRNIVQYTFAGCPPILSYISYARPGCAGFNANVLKVIERYNIDTVVISSRWDQLRQRGLSGLEETVARLTDAGVTVYVLGQSPMFAFDVDVLDYRRAGGRSSDGRSVWQLGSDPKDNARLKSKSAGATFVDPLPSFCQRGDCAYRSAAGLLFEDYGHFSDAGSDLAVRSYFPLYAANRTASGDAVTDSTPPRSPARPASVAP